tara:strand:- start:1334 stop:2326 length:993 start_codon:yes stop_codon:yes gene_type:complete
METIIAIILLLIMILMDTHSMERFLNLANPIKINLKSDIKKTYNSVSKDISNISKGNINSPILLKGIHKPTMWIYNNHITSSRHWCSFYSRKYKQPTSGIINLCLKTIIRHSCNNFKIKIFSQDDIPKLLPNYLGLINSCNSDYMRYNCIKYAILHKYGGIWIPKDTVMLKPISYHGNLNPNYITTFSINNNNYIDNAGISDHIIAAPKNNKLIKTMLSYLNKNSVTFQNALVFKQSINKQFNNLIRDYKFHIHNQTAIIKKCNGSHYNINDLFSTNQVKFLNGNIAETIDLHINTVTNLREYNYILRMSERQIVNSNLFISVLIRKALS